MLATVARVWHPSSTRGSAGNVCNSVGCCPWKKYNKLAGVACSFHVEADVRKTLAKCVLLGGASTLQTDASLLLAMVGRACFENASHLVL